MKTKYPATVWDCKVEGCGTRLQPVDPTTGWDRMAREELSQLGVGASALAIAHCVHRMIVHDDRQ